MRAKDMVKDTTITPEAAIIEIGKDFQSIREARKANTADKAVAPYLECYQKWQSFARGRKIKDLDAVVMWVKQFPPAAALTQAQWDQVCAATKDHRTSILKAVQDHAQRVVSIPQKPQVDSRIKAIEKAGGADLVVT